MAKLWQDLAIGWQTFAIVWQDLATFVLTGAEILRVKTRRKREICGASEFLNVSSQPNGSSATLMWSVNKVLKEVLAWRSVSHLQFLPARRPAWDSASFDRPSPRSAALQSGFDSGQRGPM